MRELRDKGVRDTRVVPRGIGASAAKNEDNLGIVTAEYLIDAILENPSDTVSVCMSCGNTLLAVVMQFTDYLRRNHDVLDELKQKTLVLYPLSLYWEPTLQFNIDSEYPSTSIYPSALVVYLAMQLMTLGCKVIAHAPQPPLDFYREFDDMGQEEQSRQVTKYSSYLDQAKRSDIFLLGIGAGHHDARYGTVLDDLGIDLSDELPDDESMAGEIGYQPFDSIGKFAHFPKLIAVSGEELAGLSRTETKIIATLGGEQKIPALKALLQRDQLPFNVLVTDEAIANIFDTATAQRW
jgi:DNA-binding transcriptional regulator LsrR (DeoR family)